MSKFKLGNNDPYQIKIGTNDVKQVKIGDKLVWEKYPHITVNYDEGIITWDNKDLCGAKTQSMYLYVSIETYSTSYSELIHLVDASVDIGTFSPPFYIHYYLCENSYSSLSDVSANAVYKKSFGSDKVSGGLPNSSVNWDSCYLDE